GPGGGVREPGCVAAREPRSGRYERVWLDGARPLAAPYPTGSDVLFVAYHAPAEVGCHLAQKWPIPERILDLCVEFRNLTNGRPRPHGAKLLGALAHHGFPAIGGGEKKEMQQLALRGGTYSAVERAALLEYCQS